MELSKTADDILDAAERMARSGGYNGFSFREIAEAVGVKSSSVHYHFPTKQDLAAAMAKRYTENFLSRLGEPSSYIGLSAALDSYIDAYRHALVHDGLMCLCGILGAEADRLPPIVRSETKSFFERNLDWLIELYRHHEVFGSVKASRSRAAHVISTLEGAIILARTIGDMDFFEDAVEDLKK